MHRILPAGLLAAALVLLGAAAPASAVSESASDATFEELDGTYDVLGNAVPDVTQRTFDIASSGRVGRVEVDLEFAQAVFQCGDSDTGTVNLAYYFDMDYRLTSPSGTSVTLIASSDSASDTESGNATYGESADSTPETIQPGPTVSVRLVSGSGVPVVGSTNDRIPQDGTFLAAESLDAFVGEPAAGEWTLTVADVFEQSPHCYHASAIEVGILPELEGAALPFGVVGRDYETQIPGIPEASTLAIVDDAEVPAGLTVDEAGVVTGVPEQVGAYAFDATVTDEEGTSEPATFTLDVLALPTIDGPATAEATIGEAFSYAPTFYRGVPEADAVATGLPAGLEVDAATAAIIGTPAGPAGEYVVDYVADNGLEPAATHQVTITIVEADVPPTTAPPTDPAPTDPAPTDPAPTDPAPTTPVPTAPAPSEPIPAAPTPSEPPTASSLPPTGVGVGLGLLAAAIAAIGLGLVLRRRRA